MIGERLRKVRREKKISQKELAEIIGVQNTAISLYESNKNDPSDNLKVEIAKYFNVSLDYLLGIIDEPVGFYNKEKFIELPNDMTSSEKQLLNEFANYLEYRRKFSKTKYSTKNNKKF